MNRKQIGLFMIEQAVLDPDNLDTTIERVRGLPLPFVASLREVAKKSRKYDQGTRISTLRNKVRQSGFESERQTN